MAFLLSVLLINVQQKKNDCIFSFFYPAEQKECGYELVRSQKNKEKKYFWLKSPDDVCFDGICKICTLSN